MSENKSYMENKEAAASGFSQDATHYQLLKQQPIEIMQRLMTLGTVLRLLLGNHYRLCVALWTQG